MTVDADEEADELRPVGGEGAGGRGHLVLRGERPARASTSTIGTNRPSSIATPSAVLSHGVFAVSPAKAEPLLFDAEVNA